MLVSRLEEIFEKISPYMYRILRTEDILKWKDENSDNENIKILDFSEIDSFECVIIAAFEYNSVEPVLPEGCMSISPYYYFSNKYYMKLKNELGPMEDSGEIRILRNAPLKTLANLSGLGYYGKNSIIHNDEFGSSMFLYGLVINEKNNEDLQWKDINCDFTDCGSCRRCIEACPSGALDESGLLNREKCIRNYMLEGIEVPEDIGNIMGKRLLGCNICRNACPKNNRKPLTERMPDYDQEIFLIRNYLDNKDKGLKNFINPLSEWIGRNYARTKRVLYQCEIIDKNERDDLE
jgi:ferredoxin